MAAFQVVSIDMFLTLVDLPGRRHQLWKSILGDAYAPEKAEELFEAANQLIDGRFHEIADGKDFRNLRSIFAECYRDLFERHGLSLDAAAAVDVLIREHGLSAAYDDVRPFFEAVSPHYPICLASDADRDMIAPLLKMFPFDAVFVSEDLQAYKCEPKGRMFSKVLDHYGVDPRRILHIGDSFTDIAGAGLVGIRTCWLNRNGRPWNHPLLPDHEVRSLLDVPPLIGISREGIA